MLSQRWKCVNIQYNRAGSGVDMWEKMKLSKGQRTLNMTKKNEEDGDLGRHRGWDKRHSGKVEAVIVLAQALGLLSVATGEGGTPLSGFPDS